MLFSEKELKIKNVIESSLVPAIHQKMAEGNPIQYALYNGRCCKQIAYLLVLYLNKALPEYIWTAWESMFDENECWAEEPELYAHAWTFGRSSTDPSHCIIMDYGKLEVEYSFFLRTSTNEYPKILETEDDEIDLDSEDDDYRKELKPCGFEAFTQKTFEEILLELESEIQLIPARN